MVFSKAGVQNYLQDEQAAWNSLVDKAPCLVVVIRADHTIAYFNSFAEQLTGYSADEVSGKDYFLLFLREADREGVVAEIRRILDGGVPSQGQETPLTCRDGTQRWLAWNVRRLDGFEQQPVVLAVGHDVTERRRTEQALQHQAASLRAVLNTAVDAIITIDEGGIVRSFNPAAQKVFGYTAEEVIGRNVSLLMPSPFREEHDGYLATYLETGEAKIIGIGREIEALRKDGTTFPCEIAISEVELPDRRFFTGTVRDITDRKRAQDALMERETLLQTIFDTEPECVNLLGPGGILMRMNRAGLAMIEADSFQQVEGKCVYPLIVTDDRQAFASLTDRVFEGETGTLEFEIVGFQGTRRRLETHSVPLQDPQGKITALLGITRDITEQKRAEDRARQSERLAAIGQTVAGLAHESRNAFQRSQACLEMLLLELEGNSEALELVGRTQRALNHLHHLYEEVRDYAAPINLDPQMCQITHVWRDAWSHLEVMRKEKQVQLREATSGVELSCNVDWFAMGQVFRNVFENALGASRQPGEIAITCRPSRVEGRDAIEISIRDNGPGLEPDVRDKVFDAFFTTKTKGTGLGMAIARRIVEAHGGRIAVGNPDRGAEFVITLPRTQ